MFTKEDYKKYFDQIARIERTMIYMAHDILSKLEDKSAKEVLRDIGNDELRHYVLVKDALDVFFLSSEAEKRKYQRENLLGEIEVKREITGVKAEAWCVNISQSGLCMESRQSLRSGDKISLSIKLYSKEEALNKSGVVVWIKETQSGLYISGVAFQ